MSGGCCSPLGPGSTPGSAFRIQDDGSLLPAEPALNVINGDLADDPGAATNLTLYYQFVANSDGPFPQRKELRFSDKFVLGDSPGFDATDVDLDGQLLPSVGVPDSQDVLAVNALGVWAAAANGFLKFTTAANRNAYPGLRTEGMLAYVANTQCLYMLAPDLTTWLFFAPSPALALQAAWAVDIAAGNDNNTGLPGSPIATTEELSRRLSPNGVNWNMAQTTAITIAAGSYGSLYLVPAPVNGAAVNLTINGAVVQTAATLTSVVNTTAGTQGRITIAAGPTFTARMRIRSTSGAAIGAVTYGVGALNSSTDTFIKAWVINGNVSPSVVANGTTVALEVLQTTIAQLKIVSQRTSANAGSITISDFISAGNITCIPTGGSSGMVLQGCQFNGARIAAGNVRFSNCQLTGATLIGSQNTTGSAQPVFAGCAFQGTPTVFGTVSVVLNSPCSFDACTFRLAAQAQLAPGGGPTTSHEWCNGAGLTAVQVDSGASVNWGPASVSGTGPIFNFGTAYATGWLMFSGSTFVTTSMANIQIASTTNVSMAGNARTYAQLPGYYGRAACFFALQPDTGAAFTNT